MRNLFRWLLLLWLTGQILTPIPVAAEDHPLEGFPAAPLASPLGIAQPETDQLDSDRPAPVASLQPAQPESTAFVLHPPYSAAPLLPLDGYAMYYNPGVIARVLGYRLKHYRSAQRRAVFVVQHGEKNCALFMHYSYRLRD